ncbi:MAG: DNA recombination protein RmuC [Alphaproteobacteria bacterium]|nr:DNA recombination protein RmuC [Alphaproteobacteria bacterium]
MGEILLFTIFATATLCVASAIYYRARTLTWRKDLASLQARIQEETARSEELTASLHKAISDRDLAQTIHKKDLEFWEKEKALYEDTEKRLTASFESMTHKMLRSSERALLEQTSKSLENFSKNMTGTLSGRASSFEKLETSLKEGITLMNNRVIALTKEHSLLEGVIKDQNAILTSTKQTLMSQTEKLLYALKTPQVRGQWGEVQLRRIVELAGMEAYCDFSSQQTIIDTNEETILRPDLIINLPHKRHIVIDAKVPLTYYLEGIEEPSSAERAKKMSQHAKHVWGHVNHLSSKKYWKHFNSPEFVVLFLPGDPFLSAAMEQDPSLLERASNASVILATPSTLIALLKTIHYGWKNIHITENVRHILDISATLLQRTDAFAQHFQKIGKSLEATNSHFNKAVSSFETRLLPSAKKLQKLGISINPTTSEIPQIITKPRFSDDSEV